MIHLYYGDEYIDTFWYSEVEHLFEASAMYHYTWAVGFGP